MDSFPVFTVCCGGDGSLALGLVSSFDVGIYPGQQLELEYRTNIEIVYFFASLYRPCVRHEQRPVVRLNPKFKYMKTIPIYPCLRPIPPIEI